MKTKTVWIVWTNTDTTEGRGTQYPLHICESRATAERLSVGVGVMGSDGGIEAFEAVQHEGGSFLAPFYLRCTSPIDKLRQAQIDAKEAAIRRARELGMSTQQIDAMQL